MGKIYVAIIGYNDFGDDFENIVFSTPNKDKVIKWVGKYNDIINSNKDRIAKYYQAEEFDKPEPFWGNLINYENPVALYREIEYRE